MAIAHLNGAWTAPSDAKISVFDRGFMFGDGVYEVMPVYGGKIFTKTAHLERLARSLREIRLTTRFSEDDWSQLLDQAVEKAGEDNALIYLQVTRGVAPERSHVYLAAEPTVLITVTPFTPNNEQDIVSLRVCTKEDFRWHRADIKVTSLIANGMIKNEALAEGYHDAIMVRAGFVTEATSSNVFMVVDREIMTPPKSELLLHGITILILKMILSSDFKSTGWLNKIGHVIESLHVPDVYKDFDVDVNPGEERTPEDYRMAYKSVLKETVWMTSLQMLSNLLLLVPLLVTGGIKVVFDVYRHKFFSSLQSE